MKSKLSATRNCFQPNTEFVNRVCGGVQASTECSHESHEPVATETGFYDNFNNFAMPEWIRQKLFGCCSNNNADSCSNVHKSHSKAKEKIIWRLATSDTEISEIEVDYVFCTLLENEREVPLENKFKLLSPSAVMTP